MYPLARRTYVSLFLITTSTTVLQAQIGGERLDQGHPIAQRLIPLIQSVLEGDLEAALSHAGEHAADSYRDGAMVEQIRTVAAQIRLGGAYEIESVLHVPSIGVIVQLRHTAGGASMGVMVTMQPEPDQRITGIRPVQMQVGTAPSSGTGAASTPTTEHTRDAPAPGAAAEPVMVLQHEHYEIHAPAGTDVEGIRRDLDFAVARWERYFGPPPSRLAVVMFPSPAEVPSYDFAPLRSRGLATLPWAENLSDLGGHRSLPHEACHFLFRAYAQIHSTGEQRPTTGPRTQTYGVRDVADWFDEAVAVLCEYPELQARRLQLLAEHWDDRIPLEELLSMEHPLMDLARTAVAPAPAGAMSLTARTLSADQHAALARRAAMFYSQSYSFGRFLAERYGESHLRGVANRLVAAADPEHRLFTRAELSRLEQEWERWVAAGGN
jgi:hypothetical protein